MHKVLIHPATYDNVGQAVDLAFAHFPRQLSAKRVLIKPNVLRSANSQEGIVTHPAVLRAVVEQVEAQRPAEIIVGDNPGLLSYGANEKTFEESGLMEAAKGYYQNIGTDSVKVDFNPEFMESVTVSRIVMEADVVISLPKFKTHGLTVLTGAIKNSYGILPGAQKARLHQAAGSPERFHEVVVDVFKLRVPDFFIMDAILGMEGNGPASPDIREIGKIMAADNAVAMDSVMAQMMGLDPGRLRFFRKAEEDGLGDYRPEAIEVTGTLEPIPDFVLPPLGGEATLTNPVIRDMISERVRLVPEASEWCTGCGTCVDQCPVGALEMGDDGLPHADAENCITCFCCQEMCPEKAMTLR